MNIYIYIYIYIYINIPNTLIFISGFYLKKRNIIIFNILIHDLHNIVIIL